MPGDIEEAQDALEELHCPGLPQPGDIPESLSNMQALTREFCRRGGPAQRSGNGLMFILEIKLDLRCSDGSLYCGATNDLERRVQEHNLGIGAHYTKSRLPDRLVWSSRKLS